MPRSQRSRRSNVVDLRLYTPTGNYADQNNSSEYMQLVRPEDPSALGIEVIAGKVVKYMLTSRGSDAFDPDYGGVSMHHTQISQAFLPQLTLEVHDDVQRCTGFIKRSDGNNQERLLRINVLDIRYNARLTPDRVDVYLEILTTKNNRAVVAITTNQRQAR